MGEIAATNQEAADAWSGLLFDRLIRYRELVADGLGAHGARAMVAHPPQPGDRVFDIGCGFGDTTQRLAELVGRDGEAVGVDVAEPFIAAAREEDAAAGTERISFIVADVQAASWMEVSTTPSREWSRVLRQPRRGAAQCAQRWFPAVTLRGGLAM